jgi:genetic interactor of prohibitins 3, mitochondrial
MSFIITRSDLLAPRKEQVDQMMPYLLEVLRDALGLSATRVRLGNVYCVSSKRGWWTKKLKEDIWGRGGGGWLVGKVNVGKSNLFDSIFPKGHGGINTSGTNQGVRGHNEDLPSVIRRQEQSEMQHDIEQISSLEEAFVENSLLPPAPLETPYPVMPVVSRLPGTTAAPIRLSFGGGKGELVDLPGLLRGVLESYVQDGHKPDLVMEQRVTPKQFVLKPGHSLLIGGLIRITPATPDITVLAYPFVPIQSHVTSTAKTIEIQRQSHYSGVSTIARPSIGDKIASAGTFPLKWDVTKQRAGPLTSTNGVGLDAKLLPFTILSTDILIEGCGWVELSVQIRKRSRKVEEQGSINMCKKLEVFPQIEVFSPEGNGIGARRPMNAWLLGRPKPISSSRRKVRPRRSMKGSKKRDKGDMKKWVSP